MSDCDGSSCSGRYEWGDGSTYDFLASGNMRVVQNERDPCFRLMVGDSQVTPVSHPKSKSKYATFILKNHTWITCRRKKKVFFKTN